MSEPLTDAQLAALRADLTDKLHLITEKERELTELHEEAGDLASRINAEEERRKDLPGTVLHPRFRPQPGGKPEDA